MWLGDNDGEKKNKAHLFGLLEKGIEDKIYYMPLMSTLWPGQANDVWMVLKVLFSVIAALIWVRLIRTRKNENFHVIDSLGARVVTYCFMCLFITLPFILDHNFILRSVFIRVFVEDDDNKRETVVDLFSSGGVFTAQNLARLFSTFLIAASVVNPLIIVKYFFTSFMNYIEVVLSKNALQSFGKDDADNLESPKVTLVSTCKESVAIDLSKQSKSYRIRCWVVTLIKGLRRYILVVSLLGFLPQNCAFNSSPIFALVGKTWCVKLDHLFYGLVVSFYYKRIPTLRIAFSFKSTFDLILSFAFTLLTMMLFFGAWLAVFFRDLVFNSCFLSLYFLTGEQGEYFNHPNSIFTLKGIEFLMKSKKFSQCFRSDMSSAQEEAINQVVEFIFWIHSILVDSFVAFTTLFLLILPFVIFLLLQHRISRFQGISTTT